MTPTVESADPDRIAACSDFAVLSLPNGLACQLAPQLLERGVRVVDLSADFRYRSLEQWLQVYARRPAPSTVRTLRALQQCRLRPAGMERPCHR